MMSRGQAGTTILETLVAILILGLTTSAVVSCVVTGDRIAGRRTALSYATSLARSEAEKLRSYETSMTLPNDTAYSSIINGMEFDVSRTRIRVRQDTVITDSAASYGEYSISVQRKNVPLQTVSVRLLQGYYGDRQGQ